MKLLQSESLKSSPVACSALFNLPPGMTLPPGLGMPPPGLAAPPGISLTADMVGTQPAVPPGALNPLAMQTELLQHAMLATHVRLPAMDAYNRAFQAAYVSQCYAVGRAALLGGPPGVMAPPTTAARTIVEVARAEPAEVSPTERAKPTTVVVKKVPKSFTRAMLLDLLDTDGFQRCYDFVYAPIDFEKCLGTGCFFINFVEHDTAESFMKKYQGFKDWGVKCGSSKAAAIAWSEGCQGRQTHIDRYRDSPVMHPSVPDEYRPVIFDDGMRVEFPPPTRLPKAPRLRCVQLDT